MREDEFKRYAKEHMQKRWEDAGNETYLEGRGIHGRTVEERIEDSLNGVKSRNQEPWDDKEIILAKILSEFDEYQHRNKRSNKCL